MSDNLQPSNYANCFKKTKSYEHQFRVLVMQLFMDLLSMEQIHRFFFVYELPSRLKDYGIERLRSEVLTYTDEQMLDKWRETPSALQEVLKTLGRPDLSTRVQRLVEKYSAATVCQETAPFTSQQEAGVSVSQQTPIQETQVAQTQDNSEDQLQRDYAGEDRSSTEGEVCRDPQPVCRNPRHIKNRKSLKQHREPLENILEETNLLQDDDKHDCVTGSLKRSASTASQASFRSSGYFSNPRASVLRLSQVSTGESITENDGDYQEEDIVLLDPIKQTHRDSMEDEGISIHHTSEFRVESYESSGTESSSPASSPSKSADEAPAFAAEDQDDLPPILRERCIQISRTPSHKRKQPKQNDVLYSEILPEHSEMRGRSASLPNRTSYVQAQNAAVRMPGPQPLMSHSSSMSLDSDTTYGSPSEQSSMTGSQLSIASTTSSHDSKPNSLSRHMSPPHQKPLPVDSGITVMGSMKVKVKEVLKLIDKNSQNPVLSGEFPSFKGHRGPCYEMRFFPSTFSKEKCSALYIDVARSYLNKKSKRKEQHRTVEIPAMNITVQLSYDGGESGSIKTETLEIVAKKIDSCGDASNRLPVASFPKLVSHAELGLSEAIAEGRSSLVIHVDMSVRSS